MQEEEQTIADILSSIRQVLSKEAEALDREIPVQRKKQQDDVFELTEQMRLSQNGLVTPQTAIKTQASFDKLSAFKETNENTILLKELKPLLQAWLNEHLPDIVEDVVTREVRRIINRN